MRNHSSRDGKREQEEACVQAFLVWLGGQRAVSYELSRADEDPELMGRWDFNAGVRGHTEWVALEVKGLVIPQSRGQFWDWSRFCTRVTKELQSQGAVQGTFYLMAALPWKFNQEQGKKLVKAFVEALQEMAPKIDADVANLGPGIASRFGDWPSKPPTIDLGLWHEQGISKVIHLPEDLVVSKLEDTGCCLELGASVGQAFGVDPALQQALLGIFDARDGKGAKPNEQLREAKQRGASETILLLDSHIRWKPNVVAQALRGIDGIFLSEVDAAYLVSVANSRIKRVWP